MIALGATVGGLVAVGLLLVAGFVHGIRFQDFRAQLAQQAIWPARFVALVAVVVVGTELVLGVAGAAALILPNGSAPSNLGPTPMMLAVSAMYIAFTIYGMILLRRRPGAPCGCSASGSTANVWVPVRSALVATICLLPAAVPDRLVPAAGMPRFVVALLAAASFVALLWNLPAALHDPHQRESSRDIPALPPRAELNSPTMETS
jgi:hypothetical protein